MIWLVIAGFAAIVIIGLVKLPEAWRQVKEQCCNQQRREEEFLRRNS